MERKWVVTALYCPAPRMVKRYGVAEAVVPPGAGAEFKFTVRDAPDEFEAVAAVIGSGFFLCGLSKQFGFIAKEVT